MVLKIDNKEYKLHFGIGFVRELDKKYYTESKTGVRFGMGMEIKIPLLLGKDIITLAEFLYEGTCTEEQRPTQEEIDGYIDGVKDIEKLFTEVIQELKKQNATKLQLQMIEEQLKEETKSLKK